MQPPLKRGAICDCTDRPVARCDESVCARCFGRANKVAQVARVLQLVCYYDKLGLDRKDIFDIVGRPVDKRSDTLRARYQR